MSHNQGQIQLQIDGRTYLVTEPVTGAALYALGQIQGEYDLYREVRGSGDDELIPNSDAVVHVQNGDQFYSAKRTLNPGA